MQSRTYDIGFTTNFEHINSETADTQKFTILYTHGFCSDPWGRKPEEIKKWCLQHNIPMYRYELAGHGSDIARFEETDINIYKAQILEIIDKYIKGDIVVVGSSLGGWLSLLAAVNRPTRIKGVIGLAAAPDFTIDLEEKYLTPEQNEIIRKQGRLEFANGDFKYVFTKRLLNSGRENQMLHRTIDIDCPVRLIQGQKDASLDWRKSLQISQAVKGNNVMVELLKYSNHRLGSDDDLVIITRTLDALKDLLTA